MDLKTGTRGSHLSILKILLSLLHIILSFMGLTKTIVE
jgi:hypothetical protein